LHYHGIIPEYFSIDGEELCRYDPDTGVVQTVTEIVPGSGDSGICYLTVFDGYLYLQANDGTHGPELWRYDPGTDSTHLVADINPGSDSSWPSGFTVFGGDLYFNADDGTHGYKLWRTGSLADI
jgi:ELWxxDGT repeat protein